MLCGCVQYIRDVGQWWTSISKDKYLEQHLEGKGVDVFRTFDFDSTEYICTICKEHSSY